jgi:outer membrane biosynthesis protein TonB
VSRRGGAAPALSLAEATALAAALPGLCMFGLEALNLSRCGLTPATAQPLLKALATVLAGGPDACSRLVSFSLNDNPFVADVVRHLEQGRGAQPEPGPEPEPKPEPKPIPKPDLKPIPKPEAKPEPKPEPKPEAAPRPERLLRDVSPEKDETPAPKP